MGFCMKGLSVLDKELLKKSVEVNLFTRNVDCDISLVESIVDLVANQLSPDCFNSKESIAFCMKMYLELKMFAKKSNNIEIVFYSNAIN